MTLQGIGHPQTNQMDSILNFLELPQDPNSQSQSEKSLTGSGFSKHLHMANGGCKQTEKDKSGCSYTGKQLLHYI